jgi:tetratricopeptide (TPR) repeat protein
MRAAHVRWWLLATAVFAARLAQAQGAGRLVEEIGVSEQGGDVAVTVLFGCGLRYVSHAPASSGELLRVRLAPQADCGAPAAAWSVPPALDDRGVISAVDVERVLGTDVELRIRWSRPEEFVLVPSFGGRGLRIRLVRPETDRSRVTVREVTGGTSTYAINLDAAREPFAAEAVADAAKATGVRIYVSETVVDEERWYRLRAGPFLSEADARRVLATARAQYPKAWLAIGDDASLTAVGSPDAVAHVPATQQRASASLTGPDLERTLQQARAAFRRKDYATAIPLLTRLVEQPEFPGRAEALELLGLARERSGQLAHAKAEYEEYLRRYPEGEAAERTRKRLRALAFATSPAAVRAANATAGESPWKTYGGWSQTYRRDDAGFDNGSTSGDRTTQNTILTDVAFTARRRGERYDFASRVSAGYGLDLLQDGPGDQSRVTTLFAELRDRELDWTLRGGRQSGGLGGLVGTYDGLYASYQLQPRLRLNVLGGYPVESTRTGPDTDRRFYAVSADLGTFGGAWDLSTYAISQQYFGMTDRQAIGTEVRYFRPGLTFVGLVDYDIHYGDLNDVLLLGTVALPARWTASLNLDHRRSPTLTSRNALIGQPVTRFDQLYGLYSEAEIEQLARDRSATSDVYTLSLSRPVGERWQWTLDMTGMSLGATPESGGVPATEGTGTDLIVSTQALGYGLFGRGDVSSLGLQFQDGDTTSAYSLGVNAQFPVGRTWRVGPRLRIDQREYHLDGSDQLLYSPSLRTELRGRHMSLEFEGGAEFGSRSLDDATEDTTRYYLSLGYRYDF